MKYLLTIFTLLLTLMFSSTSLAGWTKVGSDKSGTDYYIDFERMRKADGFIYFWYLLDYSKPIDGYLSLKRYYQGDCKIFRLKYLSSSFHKEPFGGGIGQSTPPVEWVYPSPNSINEYILKSVCSR